VNVAAALNEVGDAYIRRYPSEQLSWPGVAAETRGRRGVMRYAVATTGLLVAAVAAATIALTGRDPSSGPRPFGTERPPRALEVIATIPVSGAPEVLTASPDGSVWVGIAGASVVERILSTTNEVLSAPETQGPVSVLAADDVFVYYGAPGERIVSQIPGHIESATSYGYRARHLDVFGNRLVVDAFGRDCRGSRGSCLHVIDLTPTGLGGRDVEVPVGCCRLSAIAADDGRVWVAGGDDDGAGVVGIDIESPGRGRRFGPVELPEVPTDLVVYEDLVWAALPESETIAVFDMASLDVRSIDATVAVEHLAAEANRVWGISADGGVVQVDARRGRVTGRADLGMGLIDVVAADGSAWVASGTQGVVLRIGAP
jgi:DNA-binding beta-propeller fold protein YncE